ncbi:MAG: carbohydrate-binding module family 50 protein [Nocardioides sp.]|jgi:LysM repeat protein|uniref:LysM peptidoglycan-binding domain-containing protein n=1 Tax=Nocardioides sp. TaxID=35761 RepID=UPI0026095203|nr:LysM domain-containing protein [Nocardioides sp.]MCW2833370.1 carbohydrate-binding module family 50 protein [Nocardioides sp.]
MGFLDNVRGALRDAVSTRASKQTTAASRTAKDDVPAAAAVETTPEVFDTYTVEVGDTLQEISARAGTSVEEVVRINDIEDPDLIFPGQVFRIPMR